MNTNKRFIHVIFLLSYIFVPVVFGIFYACINTNFVKYFYIDLSLFYSGKLNSIDLINII